MRGRRQRGSPGRRAARRRVQPGLPGLAGRLRAAGPGDPRGRQPGCRPPARPRPPPTAPGSCRRRRARCTASRWSTPSRRRYWGNVNPIGPAVGLRRGQAVRRGPDHGLPPPARPRGPDRPDLQHLRPRDARRRRPGGQQLRHPGPPQASRSPSTATAPRPGASATSTTWPPGCWPCSTRTAPVRSTSATTTSAPCSRSPNWCSSCRAPRRGSSSPLDPPTTRPCAVRTSPVARRELGWEPTHLVSGRPGPHHRVVHRPSRPVTRIA